MNLKKLLLITYYWPPAGGGGVQRWLKMSKYFRDFGWELVVFTPEKTDATLEDLSLLKEVRSEIEVIRSKIWEPYDLFKKLSGKKKKEKINSGFINEKKKSSIIQEMSFFIRGNFFIPDARKFWIKPATKELSSFLKGNKIDAIVSTGPPHSTHIIAMNIKKKFDLPWIADFRDPWTKIGFYEKLNLTYLADYRHKYLEKKVLETADKVVTVSWAWAKDLQSISEKANVNIITNGFDHNDFATNENVVLDNKFTITHIGSMNADRNPKVLWKVLSEICNESETIKNLLEVKLYGPVDYSVIESIKNNNLETVYKKFDFLPHREVIKIMQKSQILMLPINNTKNLEGVLPGKLYEYIGSQRPILAIGPKQTDSYKIISETKAGKMFEYDEFSKLKEQILSWFNAFQSNKLQINSSNFNMYKRMELAKKYTELLNSAL